ncbi:MAG: hypothetical protein MJE68_31655 [Proteobacteria bacterium]|nr:hypothetical protein [Pseudomonadota bacterium]
MQYSHSAAGGSLRRIRTGERVWCRVKKSLERIAVGWYGVAVVEKSTERERWREGGRERERERERESER